MAEWKAAPLKRYVVIGNEERRCPYCGYPFTHKHGGRVRQIRDWKVSLVYVERMRCPACRKSYTVYPAGVDAGVRRSRRARHYGMFLYAFGLAYRKASEALAYLGVKVVASTILRDVVGSGMQEEIKRSHNLLKGRVDVKRVGVDGTGVPMAGNAEAPGVVVIVDLESGTGLWVRAIDEQDAEAVGAFLQDALRILAPEEIVTDEAGAYPPAIFEASAATERAVQHRLCAAHFRRNKMRRLKELREQAEKHGHGFLVMKVKAMERLLRSPPEQMGGYARRLYQDFRWAKPPKKGQKASWAYRVKQLALEIWEKSPQVTGITNNRTEQFIGRAFKVRVRSMRGFKNENNRIAFLNLMMTLDRMRQQDGVLCLN